MTDTAYLIWFIATAVAIVALLTIGTLAAADLLQREPRTPTRPVTVRSAPVATADSAPVEQSAPATARHRDAA